MTISGIYSCVDRVSVLFVDDDEDARFVYHAVASAEGLIVELASDGTEAVALANILLPDVIVLDIRLPDFDGFEVARRLRASSRTCSIPIVMVSGDDSDGVDSAFQASGCDARLVKPLSADELLRLVAVLALRRRAPAEAAARGSGR